MAGINSISWGIIGCGNVTEVKSGPALQKIKNSDILAVMRRDATRAEDYAKRHGIAEWYTDARAIINHPGINAVYVATPPSSHMKYTIMALEKKKPVYVEKPMALNYGQCLKMIQAAQKFNTKLFVAYYRRGLPSFVKVKQILDSGILGRVQMVNIRFFKAVAAEIFSKGPPPWRFDTEISGGGLLYDLASHQLDLLDYFFGPVREVVSRSVNQSRLYNAADMAEASFRFDKGITGNCQWNFASSPGNNSDRFGIIAENGAIAFSTFAFTPVKVVHGGKTREFIYPKPKHVEQPLLESVVSELLGSDKCPSTGISASRTNLVLEKITGTWPGYYL